MVVFLFITFKSIMYGSNKTKLINILRHGKNSWHNDVNINFLPYMKLFPKTSIIYRNKTKMPDKRKSVSGWFD